MSIKTRFIILIIFSLAAITVIGFFFIQNTITVSREIKKQGMVSEIHTKLFEQASLRDEYFLYHSERPIVQLRAVSKNIEKLLVQISGFAASAEEQAAVRRIKENNEYIEQTLAQIILSDKDQTGSSSQAKELGQRLISRILAVSQENSSTVLQLTNISRSRVVESQNWTMIFVSVFFTSTIIIILLTTAFVWFFVAGPLRTQKKDALRIASLDLSSSSSSSIATLTRNDELGMLARAFDIMTIKLKESYMALEERVHERTIELEAVNEKIETILHSVGDGIFAVDLDQKIILLSDAAVKMSGFSEEEAVGRNHREILKFVREKDGGINDMFVEKTICGSGRGVIESGSALINIEGKKVPIAGTATPFKDAQGTTIGCVVVFRDITKEREAEKIHTDFLTLASHQLRTPLSGTKWLVETMKRGIIGKLNTKQKEYVDRLYKINERMIKLVFDMLNVLRLESGVVTRKKKAVTVGELFRDLLLRAETTAEARLVAIRCSADEKKLIVKTDSEAVKAILECFLSNAINFSHLNQEIIFDVKENPAEFVFFVKDKGIGIP